MAMAQWMTTPLSKRHSCSLQDLAHIAHMEYELKKTSYTREPAPADETERASRQLKKKRREYELLRSVDSEFQAKRTRENASNDHRLLTGMPVEMTRLLNSGVFVPPIRSAALAVDEHLQPFNFGPVIPGVYRCSYPKEEDYRYIRKLKLKTVVTLVQKDMPPSFKHFLSANGIRHEVFDMNGTKKESIPLDLMKGILRVVLDQRHHPVLIHCNHGKHRTGCVVGVVRKLSGWQVPQILEEYKSYASPKVRETDVKYIENFEILNLTNLFAKPEAVMSCPRFRRIVFVVAVICLIWLATHIKLSRPNVSSTAPHSP